MTAQRRFTTGLQLGFAALLTLAAYAFHATPVRAQTTDPATGGPSVEVHHGTLEAVDLRSGTVTIDGRIHFVALQGDFLPGANGERVPVRQAIGLGAVVEYDGGSLTAAGQVRRASRVVVINVFH